MNRTYASFNNKTSDYSPYQEEVVKDADNSIAYVLKHYSKFENTKVCGNHPTLGEVEFNIKYGKHTFSSDEICELLKGNSILIASNGYLLKGRLEERDFNGKRFVGFNRISYEIEPKGDDRGIA